MQLAAAVVGGAHLGADCVAKSERFFARGAKPPVACRIGHFELEIHWRSSQRGCSVQLHRVRGVRAVRSVKQEPCRSCRAWASWSSRASHGALHTQ
jgi:hypothetical protein